MTGERIVRQLSRRGALSALGCLLACALVSPAVAGSAAAPGSMQAGNGGEGAAMTTRRLILCLDGTADNDFSLQRREQGQEVLKPSNVLKLARAVPPWDEATASEQIVYYDIGVGALTRYPGLANRILVASDQALGGAWGAGFESNIERGLTFLALNYRPGDQVFIFGFSRGAATARGLTRFLDWAGGLPAKTDAYYLPLLFRAFVVSRGQAAIGGVIEDINRQSAAERKSGLGPLQPIEVRFLGVWDTVMALGSRFKATGGSTSEVSKTFYLDKQPAACVRHARQALAVDEARFDFRPEIWEAARAEQSLAQRWFAGVHSNVGGGYVHDGLANLAFHWMVQEAQAQGLVVDPKFLRFYPGFAQDQLYNSDSTLYRILDAIRFRSGKGKRQLTGRPAAANLSLDPSVIERLRADPQERRKNGEPEFPRLTLYRPQNVLAFLACQPDLDAYLASIGLAPEHRQLPADVMQRLAELRTDCAKDSSRTVP
jgi:uncharacterized protein (DUF2235 family)